ncbi:30S ribosomal protein S4 [Candidatus Kaiserbacteria bacterium]|nr:30S ribosomal protein S4 [Candidatus Kaiserbacteria bacterium]
MRIGPKYKIGKRLGASVFEKCQTQKFVLSETRSKNARKRKSRPRAMSDFGKQLIEKQKIRYMYGVTEKQLIRYVEEGIQSKGEPALKLLQSLESRLDNVVYRLGLAQTRRFARQMVSHGHILVNGRRVTIPSYRTSVNDVVSVRENSRGKGLFAGIEQKLENRTPVSWLSFDEKKLEGTVVSLPELSAADASLDLTMVFEFYSR